MSPLRFACAALLAGAMLALPASETAALPAMREVTKAVWLRARRGGFFDLDTALGQDVKTLQRLGTLSDLFGENAIAITAPANGIVIAHTTRPLVNYGDPLVQVAVELKEAGGAIERARSTNRSEN